MNHFLIFKKLYLKGHSELLNCCTITEHWVLQVLIDLYLFVINLKVVIEIMKKSSSAKHQVLYWIGACLHGNITRKKVKDVFHRLHFLHPNISIHILHTVLYTFPMALTRRICLTIKRVFSWWSFPLFSWPQCLF